jgi:hypothetical protein
VSGFSVQVVGLDSAVAKLAPAHWEQGLRRGLLRVGQAAADAVKEDIGGHHYTGRAEQQVHAEEEHLSNKISVYVGTSAALVPELRPMVEGWSSSNGKRPPVGPIAEWLAHKPEVTGRTDLHGRNSKGFLTFRSIGRTVGGAFGPHQSRTVRGSIASTVADPGILSHAFLIARAIGKKGYSFGKTDSFRKAWERVAPTAARTIGEEMNRHV